jgi:tRNA/rRNA methyltransferase
MVYATTARERKMVKPILTPRAVGEKAVEAGRAGRKVGVLFGKERTGLEKDDVALADAVVTVPLNPEFTSLNLAQAVLLIGYEWYQAATTRRRGCWNQMAPSPRPRRALRLLRPFREGAGRMRLSPQRGGAPNMIRNLRNMWGRAELTEQEIRTLHGVVKELTTLREKKRP